jgi:molybdopterin molybdotransferase
MRPFGTILPFAEALEILMRNAVPVARIETVALDDADGRVVAEDVTAAIDVPPFDRAAMDGYAARAADTTGATLASPRKLRQVGVVYAGHMPARAVGPGECAEVATGAPMPDGADAVVMVEDTARSSDAISVMAAVVPRQHVGRRAADIRAGQPVVRAGAVLTPGRAGALAATGLTDVRVFAKPAVALLSTGNEIVPPGRPLAPGQIYDVNRFTLSAVVSRHGGTPSAHAVVGDTIERLGAAIDAARDADVLVFSGGSSVGERDLMLDALRARGNVLFHGIAVKPGKPTGFGLAGGKPVFSMPGYPTSCLSNAYLFLVPFLRVVARLPPWRPHTVDLPLARRVASAPGRHQFYTVRIAGDRAEPAFKASGDITSMADADGYFEIPAEVNAVEAGTLVRIALFD